MRPWPRPRAPSAPCTRPVDSAHLPHLTGGAAPAFARRPRAGASQICACVLTRTVQHSGFLSLPLGSGRGGRSPPDLTLKDNVEGRLQVLLQAGGGLLHRAWGCSGGVLTHPSGHRPPLTCQWVGSSHSKEWGHLGLRSLSLPIYVITPRWHSPPAACRVTRAWAGACRSMRDPQALQGLELEGPRQQVFMAPSEARGGERHLPARPAASSPTRDCEGTACSLWPGFCPLCLGGSGWMPQADTAARGSPTPTTNRFHAALLWG